jgi:ligand-binding sensor domain-containing protein/signal transduction histidine kinase
VTCWLKQTRWTLIGVVLAGFVTYASALDPNRLPSQYVREQWTTETRFPGGAVNGIAQTADGYLWIGTDRGLIRFDGFDFKPISFTSITTAPNVSMLQLFTDARGTLWIRPEGAYLVRQEDGKFESVRYGLDAITAVSKDNNDGVLVSNIGQGTFRLKADTVQKLGPSSPPVISMAETADGKIWLGTLGDGLFVLTGGRATQVNAGLPDRKINCLLPIGEGLWVGTDTGLYHGNSNGFRQIQLPSFLDNIRVLSVLRDRDSNIWVGTARGLLRINDKGISFSEENELRGDGGINALFEDREGNLWIGGARGLGRIRDSAFVTYSSIDDLHLEHSGPIYVDREGRAWFAPAQGGLYVLQNGRVLPVTSIPARDVVYSISGQADEVWAGRQRGGLTRLRFHNGASSGQTYTEANGLTQNSVYAVYESRDGSVWAGTLNGGVSKFKDGRFSTYTTTNGLVSNTVSSILETRDGAMWFATPSGLSSFSNGQWRTYTTVEGLPSLEVNCLLEDSSGTLWSGTSAGLAFFASNGRFQIPHESPDVLRKQIVGMAEDKSGRFWIATSDHVLRVPRDKLLGGVVQGTDAREYGQADGLESTRGVKRSRSVISDSAGRIWFSLSRGLSVVNPSQITGNSTPALPHIEAVLADGSPVAFRQPFRISTKQQKTTFRFVALSLANSERVRYRYRLDGFDHDWSDPVASREATYTNLSAASYTFRVIACNSDGLWDASEAAVRFEVEPTVWQTWWFRTSSAALMLLLAWCMYLYRLRQLAKEFNVRLEERVGERTRIARELHDSLLQGFQGLMFRLQAARDLLPGRATEAMQALDIALERGDKAIAEGRDTVSDLREPIIGDSDIAEALTALGKELAIQSGNSLVPRVRVQLEGKQRELNPMLRDEVYRIAREALRNAFRHARAQKIEAEITYSDSEFLLHVRDDGGGIDPEVANQGARAGHWGLPGMRERAKSFGGKLEVWSEHGAGTEIVLSVPAAIAYGKSEPRRRFWLGRKKIGESDGQQS